MKRRQMVHIGFSPGTEAIPVTLYVSKEVWADAVSVPADYLAEILKPLLAEAIEIHRNADAKGSRRCDLSADTISAASLARADADLRSGRARVLDDALIQSLPEVRPDDDEEFR
jgi:hypothetical protein